MILKTKTPAFLIALALFAFALQACALSPDPQSDVMQPTPAPGDVPTWTPRPEDEIAHPTETEPAPVSQTQTAAPATTDTPVPTPTLKQVTFTVTGGNLNIRRGPSLAYNYVGVLYDGETAIVVGRDRISRWLMIKLPGNPDARGWVTTETQYSTVNGDASSLPFIEVEPARPAFIRNCTKHKILILPDYVQLLPKGDAPYNEDLFAVGVYQVIDITVHGEARLADISLSEGRTVDIIYDGTGERSKCE